VMAKSEVGDGGAPHEVGPALAKLATLR
jgi:hypothetical protein